MAVVHRCRNCGTLPFKEYYPDEEFGDLPRLRCPVCGAMTLPFFSMADVVKQWNQWENIEYYQEKE